MTDVQLQKLAQSRKNRALMRRHGGVLRDLWASAKLHQLWRALAWEELIQRFRRSILGLSWIVISFGLMIGIFVILFGRGSPSLTTYEYTIYLGLGLATFTYLSAIVNKGTSMFAANAGWIKATPAPFAVLAFKTVTASFLELLILLALMIPVSLAANIPNGIQVLYLLAAIVLYLINSVTISILMGCLGAWSSDFQQLVPAVMRITFFATPIFWEYEWATGLRKYLATYNPFTHFVEIFRQPLMGSAPSMTNWIVVGAITIGALIISTIVFKLARQRLPVWV